MLAGIFQLAFGSWHGITGHVILFMMICMYTTAIEKCRRGTAKLCGIKLKFTGYNLFWETHKLWQFVVIVLLLHGQNYWLYVAYPICLMMIEKLIRSERAKHRMRVIECRSLAGDVMMLQFESIKHPFRYKAGQVKFLKKIKKKLYTKKNTFFLTVFIYYSFFLIIKLLPHSICI